MPMVAGLLWEGVLHNVSQKKLRKIPKTTHEPWKKRADYPVAVQNPSVTSVTFRSDFLPLSFNRLCGGTTPEAGKTRLRRRVPKVPP